MITIPFTKALWIFL